MGKLKWFFVIIVILVIIVVILNLVPESENGNGGNGVVNGNGNGVGQGGTTNPATIKIHSSEWGVPVKLGYPVNTPKWEDGPFISPDGNTLYFTIGGELLVDSYYSVKVGGEWSNPIAHTFNLPNFPDGAVHTNDNSLIYFASVRPGVIGGGDIYTFKNGEVENLGAPVNTEAMESEPYVSLDGNTLYFSSNREGGKGNLDIWYAEKVDGEWQEPVNAGNKVNTAGLETQPFMTYDGQELYFMSDKAGGVTIFKSEKQGDGSWGEPEVVISGVVGEPTLTQDKQYLYFVHIDIKGGKLTDADVYYVERK